MKYNKKLNRAKLGAITLCLGTSLGMSFFVGSTDLFIGLMLGIITVGVYILIFSGKGSTKNANKNFKGEC